MNVGPILKPTFPGLLFSHGGHLLARIATDKRSRCCTISDAWWMSRRLTRIAVIAFTGINLGVWTSAGGILPLLLVSFCFSSAGPSLGPV